MSAEEESMHQAMRPHGMAGRMFAAIMERMNNRTYRWACDRLREEAPGSVLEIGFGTGRLGQLLVRELGCQRFCGVDPSELMVEMAEQRLVEFADVCSLDVRKGDDSDLVWLPRSFDAVLAVHSFQFWPHPEERLRQIKELLREAGSFVLILRLHGGGAGALDWLPNPIAKSGNEIQGTLSALEGAGFRVIEACRIGSGSFGIHAKI
ncbi:class I SAM-dependent methyltransferase [Parvibaculaceae bacterium PLY_AMNH_Bact1]|nr:class I SAM-dependent methyltransferase [Parvibaculaceae bacterium PLY_AMNH_Bact1]